MRFSIIMYRGRNTMQKYLDLKGQRFQDGRDCNARKQDLFCKKDNQFAHVIKDNNVRERKLEQCLTVQLELN